MYILSVLEKVGGKFLYELQVKYVFDENKKKELLPKLHFKQSLMEFQGVVTEYLQRGIEKGICSPTVSMEKLVAYTGAAVDGIMNYAMIQGNSCVDSVRDEVLILFQMLGKCSKEQRW